MDKTQIKLVQTNNANTQRPDQGCVSEPNVDCNDKTVWYKFSTPATTATMPSSYKISISSSSIWPFVQIYRLDGGATAGSSHPSCATLSSFNFQNLEILEMLLDQMQMDSFVYKRIKHITSKLMDMMLIKLVILL